MLDRGTYSEYVMERRRQARRTGGRRDSSEHDKAPPPPGAGMTDAALPWGGGRPVATPHDAGTRPGADAAELSAEEAARAVALLRAFGHEGRFAILCHLMRGERSVTELERLLSSRQPAVSQQLGRLRADGLVTPRREGKQIFYRLTDPRAARLVRLTLEMFGPRDD